MKHPLLGHLTKVFNRKRYSCSGYTESKKKAIIARDRMSAYFYVRITKDADGTYKIWSREKKVKK